MLKNSENISKDRGKKLEVLESTVISKGSTGKGKSNKIGLFRRHSMDDLLATGNDKERGFTRRRNSTSQYQNKTNSYNKLSSNADDNDDNCSESETVSSPWENIMC